MDIFITYLNVFITGGIICTIGQILMDKTKLTPARILVLFVTLGVILTGLGIYDKIVAFGSAGATVPISGFGYCLANGVMEEVDKKGFIRNIYRRYYSYSWWNCSSNYIWLSCSACI